MKNPLNPIAVCNNKKDMTGPSLVNLRIMLEFSVIVIGQARINFTPHS